MTKNITATHLTAAYEKARFELLTERGPHGHWVGELATSALSTATAVSALSLVERHDFMIEDGGLFDRQSKALSPDHKAVCGVPGGPLHDVRRETGNRTDLSKLILRGIHWLADHQNPDGGWGDTDRSYSNIATTLLAVSAFRLTGVPADHSDLLDRAQQYIDSHGGVCGLRKRYGKDKTFAVPILTNCALAGIVPWSEVSALPFELACIPQRFYHFLQLPVVSYAIPALVAIGQAKYFHQRPFNPLLRLIRSLAVPTSLGVLQRIQPASGGYLEAVPLTSFVVMSLASTGRASHPVARQGVEFLKSSVRPDGSWPIDTNLATWNTTLALNALSASGEQIEELAPLDWLLDCQYREVHPFTGAAPGGWGWSDLSGAVPDADDTAGALLALAAISSQDTRNTLRRADISRAAKAGCRWLFDVQNRDGGWPTFCRGWGKLPFDRSGADLTAHALRALHVWRHLLADTQLDVAIRCGFAYLTNQQAPDGSWTPLWFGNQDQSAEENPVYGTAKVLLAYQDLNRGETPEARRGFNWLVTHQNEDGGWGGGPALADQFGPGRTSSVEETALAVEALLHKRGEPDFEPAISRGLEWLVESVETGRYLECSPIGFYFAKLWYYEKLYPLIFMVSALGQANHRIPPWLDKEPAAAHLSC